MPVSRKDAPAKTAPPDEPRALPPPGVRWLEGAEERAEPAGDGRAHAAAGEWPAAAAAAPAERGERLLLAADDRARGDACARSAAEIPEQEEEPRARFAGGSSVGGSGAACPATVGALRFGDGAAGLDRNPLVLPPGPELVAALAAAPLEADAAAAAVAAAVAAVGGRSPPDARMRFEEMGTHSS